MLEIQSGPSSLAGHVLECSPFHTENQGIKITLTIKSQHQLNIKHPALETPERGWTAQDVPFTDCGCGSGRCCVEPAAHQTVKWRQMRVFCPPPLQSNRSRPPTFTPPATRRQVPKLPINNVWMPSVLSCLLHVMGGIVGVFFDGAPLFHTALCKENNRSNYTNDVFSFGGGKRGPGLLSLSSSSFNFV